LEEGSHDDDDAGKGAERHGNTEADLFPCFELELSKDEPWEGRKQDVDDASRA
jgi:hypothetical protein